MRKKTKCDLRHIKRFHLMLRSAVQTLCYIPRVAIKDFQWGKEEWVGYSKKRSGLQRPAILNFSARFNLGMESNWCTMYYKYKLLYHLSQPFRAPYCFQICRIHAHANTLNLTFIPWNTVSFYLQILPFL